MAQVFSRTCDICGEKTLRRESYFINPASTTSRYLVCKKCGRSLGTFLKRNGLLKTMRPKSVGSQKARKLKTRRKK